MTSLPPGVRINKYYANEPGTKAKVYHPITNTHPHDVDEIAFGVGNTRQEAAQGIRLYRVVHTDTGITAEFVMLKDLDPNEKETTAPA